MKTIKLFPLKPKYETKNSKILVDATLNPRFRLKFIIYFFLLMMIPIFISGTFYLSQSKKIIIENTKSLALENASLLCKSVDIYLENLSNSTQTVLMDKTFLKQVDTLINNSFKLKTNKRIGNTILLDNINLDSLNTGIEKAVNLRSIYVLYNNILYKVYNKDHDTIASSDFSSESWYQKVINNPSKAIIVGTGIRFLTDNTYKYVITTSFYLKSFQNNKPAFFLFDFDYTTFAKTFTSKSESDYTKSDLFIVDSYDNIMFNKNLGLLTTKLDLKLDTQQFGVSEINKDGNGMYMTYFTSNNNWRVINYIPIGKLIRGAFFSPNFIILFILICIISVYLFSLILSRKLLKPFHAITMAMSENGKNDFSVQRNSSSPAPYTEQQEGISNMDMLVHKIYSTQIQQKEAQLKSLQNQINPHFLYNTLESIRGAALHYGVDTIAEMSKCLSLFFRYSISDNVLVSIRDEVQHLDNYMAIQNFRHEDKFEVVYVIPESLYDYKILKLTLQPLVENAIKHGLEMRIGKGKITISAFHLDNVIKIQIQDNGTGIPEKKLEELKNLLAGEASDMSSTGSTGTGVGMQNVNSRVKIYFGKKYGLSYSSSESGTTVEITIPVVES